MSVRIAVVSDIHSNLAALEAVLADAGSVDETWCVGDVVGYGPDPNECVELLRSRKHLCVAGNHDWAAIGRLDTQDFNADAETAVVWTRRQLTSRSRRYLEDLPLKLERGDITIVHGSPREPIWEYVLYASIAQANLESLSTAYCLVGHSHIPIIFSCAPTPAASPSTQGGGSGRVCRSVDPVYDAPVKLADDTLFINPGSVGQPRDGIPESRYVILDLADRTVTFRRVPYDVGKTQQKMQNAGLPTRLWNRLAYGL